MRTQSDHMLDHAGKMRMRKAFLSGHLLAKSGKRECHG